MKRQDLDEIARRRCLLILSVLSGELGVMEAVEQAQVSPTTYQHLETRALEAMLVALTPDAQGASASPRQRIEELEQRVAQLEKEKRRADRLLLLTRQVVKPGPVTTGAGRPPKRRARPSSTTRGKRPSPTSTTITSPIPTIASIPKTDGEAGP